MNLQEIKSKLEALSAAKNDTFSIEVSINGRLTKTLGRVMHTKKGNVVTPYKMEFSKQMLETVIESDINDIIGHEWAHYYITKTTGVNHNHDAEFKALCAEIGCFGTTSIEVTRTVEIRHKYELYCSSCFKRVAVYDRKCKTVTNCSYFKSNCCGAPLILQDNSKNL